MRTLLTITALLTFVILLPAQDFEGMAYVKAGTESIGPVPVKQNVGGSISIGEWPKTTFFIFDEYTAVIDSNGNVVVRGGLPSSESPGEKFMAEKEKWLMSNVAQPREEELTTTEPTDRAQNEERKNEKKNKKKSTQDKKTRIADLAPTDSARADLLIGRRSRLGFGPSVGYFRAGGADGFSYGATANLTFPIGRNFRLGGAIDIHVYHDYVFKKTITPMIQEGMEDYYEDHPEYTEPYKVPEGFAGVAQIRPFAGADFGCMRAGYQPVLLVGYHSIFGANTDFYPLGLGFGFCRGPVQFDFFAALKPSNSMYYSSPKLFGASVTFGNRSGKRK